MSDSSGGPALQPGRAKVRSASAGFTLLELMVVFAVMALLLALAPVAYGKLTAVSQYRSTVRHILAGLVATRQLAAQSGRSAAFSVDLERRAFGTEGRLDQTLPESVDVRLIAAGIESAPRLASIRFYPDGGSTGGSIDVLRHSGDGVRLRVDWLLGSVEQEAVGR